MHKTWQKNSPQIKVKIKILVIYDIIACLKDSALILKI